MRKLIAKTLIKIALWILPLEPDSHKVVAPIVNKWVDKLNTVWWNPKVKINHNS